MLSVGSVIDGKYKILNEIGHGGMSVVYLALNERANKTWAIKEVRKNGATSFEVVKQGLIAETNILKKLNHPHLPSIVDVIDQEDSFLVVMDYIEGTSLGKLLKTGGPQPWKDVVDWGKQLCDVLAYLHSRRPPIIYRDMKPDNVMLKPDGQVMLLDFGTAREYKFRGAEGNDTTCLGTKGYAAPEQYGGMGETDARTDIFCLGATMYHLLTGHNPSLPPYEMKPIRQINPSLPRGLEQVILKCTQLDPNLRYQSALDLAYDLEHSERVDIEYIKQQKKKLKLFIGALALSLFFGLCALGTNTAYNGRSSDQYDRYLDEGKGLSDASISEGDEWYTKAETDYIKAIDLQPGSEEAYSELARLYGKNDASVSSEEVQRMNKLLANRTLEKRNRNYPRFAFLWGSYIYFYYTASTGTGVGEGNPAMACRYLETVKDSSPNEVDEKTESGEAKIKLASIMYSIGKGQDLLKSKDKLDAPYSFADYWDDLNALMDEATMTTETGGNALLENVGQGSGNATFLLLSMYRSVINTVRDNRVEFNQAGKSLNELNRMIDKVEQANQALYMELPASISRDPSNKEMYDYINQQVESTRQYVKAMNLG